MKISVPMRRQEVFWGFVYLGFQFLILPTVLFLFSAALPTPLNDAQLNFIFYGVNFASIVVIFRKFLWQNLERFAIHPGYFFWVVLLGLGRYLVLNTLVSTLLFRLDPGFINANDSAIAEMVRSELTLIAAGTIILVPPAEECLFRGLIFGNLYQKSPVIAYLVSIAAFSAIHIIGYIGVYTPMELLISFLSYLPAGLCLGWAYVKSGSIFAPILMHAVINAIAIYGMR